MQRIKDVSKNKLRAGFYTPVKIAAFILRWAFNNIPPPDILEPSCGDGIFLQEIKKSNYEYQSLTAIELDPDEVNKAKKINLNKSTIINSDFYEFCIKTHKKFDLIIGNPPYIRYQYFNKEQQKFAEAIFKKENLKYSKLTNAWVSFVVGSSLLLKDVGKIGFVLPAEILQVSYAKPLRVFLASNFNKINIISFQKLVFPNIQQEVVLLLCEKNRTQTHLIEHLEVKDADKLQQLDLSKLEHTKKKIDFKSNKWTFYFLEQEEIDFLEELQTSNNIAPLNTFANVEVGITTGSNLFFTVPLSIVRFYALEKYAKPLVGRSVQVPSAIFTKNDWIKNRNSDAKTHFLSLPSITNIDDSSRAKDYIAWGESRDIHKGYKCKIRNEWQIVPSQRISEALFIRRNYKYPKFIVNEAQAYTTDTMHRVSIKNGFDISAVIASYYNSLSFAFAEICGRSHGGGVLELMPNEVERILLPYHSNNADLLPIIDRAIRAKKDITTILKITNQLILKENYNFSNYEIELADNIWRKLSQRRLTRGKK